MRLHKNRSNQETKTASSPRQRNDKIHSWVALTIVSKPDILRFQQSKLRTGDPLVCEKNMSKIIKLPMLQHVYPKCSSKLPQQLTSNCPGRSGLEVHVASTSAFSINDLPLNIINQNDSKLHNQRVKFLTLEFHPIGFFRFFNHQRCPTLHRPVAYLQA